ncbi:MAG TPA: hypothetical protein VJ689_04950, partial [Gaiellaceae bacterium]|nr:hypothetical protein [Gaiellaceae bacterium]
VWPTVRAVLARAASPSARAATAAQLVDQWVATGSSRLDGDLDGKIDAPGAAVLDGAWPLIADTVLRDVLGLLTPQLVALVKPDDAPGPTGSAYLDGWYSYVEKDLRGLLQPRPKTPFLNKYCGRGDAAACASSLWLAIDRAAAQLEQAQGTTPSAWRADATKERIAFAPGLLRRTMRWTNRPTFQQAISFDSHRPRSSR